jgi:protein dithiol oxidoreductase (disulfide-forming)
MLSRTVLSALLVLLAATGVQAQTFTEGKDYFAVVPAHGTSVGPGKVEVTEIFSYGCPYCAQFNPYMHQLAQSLPKNAQLVYVPASFNTAEDWPMFQRAACTAQTLGIFDKTNDAMYDAVWSTGELAVSDATTHRLKSPLPTIEDAARYYNHISGVAVDKFLAASKSFGVDTMMRTDDALLTAYQVDGTPSLIVNGKYRVKVLEGGPTGMVRLIETVKWLVAKESK